MPQPRRRHPHHPLVVAFMAVIVGTAWVLFAPTAVGGQASYVIINGNSMEPGMFRGDLAILRQRASYEVGAVVTYRHPTIGPVIHRIIARDGEQFVFQGDNNDFIDPYRPKAPELIGQVWLFVPKAGEFLMFLRQPPMFALLVALVLGTATMATSTLPTRPRRRSAPAAVAVRADEGAALLNAALTVALALGLVALGLGGLAFTQPLTQAVAQTLSYQQQVQFAYSADAPPGIYDGNEAQSGDPIFPRLSEQVAVSAVYELSTREPVQLAGTAQLLAELSDGLGWRRSLTLSPVTAFEGREVTLAGTLDLAELSAMIRDYEQQTGIRQSSYRVTLQPAYQVQGQLAGVALATSFAPSLPFVLDETRLRPLSDEPTSLLQVNESGTLNTTVDKPQTLQLWLITLEVLTARRLALAGIEIALVVGGLAGWYLNRMIRANPLAGLRLRFRVQVLRTTTSAAWMHEAIPLRALDDLARLAEQTGHPLIQVEHGPDAGLYLRDGTTVYCYRDAE